MSTFLKKNFNISKKKYFNFLYAILPLSFLINQILFKFVILIIILSTIFVFRLKIFFLKKDFVNHFFFILLLYFIFNSIFISKFYHVQNTSYILFVVIYFFYLTTNYLTCKNLINFKKIFKIQIILFLFIYLDTIYQIIYDEDIFGFESYSGYKRYSGPFGKEFILGGYISFFLIPVIGSNLADSLKSKFKIYFFILFIILSIYIALKTGERSAFLTLCLQFIFFIFLIKYFNKKLIFLLVFAFVLILSITVHFDKDIREKYDHLIKLTIRYNKDIAQENDFNNKNFNTISFFNNQTGAHFLTAYEIWKQHPLLGVGIKNFRYESSNNKYAKIKSLQFEHRVATHPHNYQLQLLSETGIFGFFIFNFFIIYFIYKIYLLKNIKNNDNIFLKIFFIVMLSKYFPIKTDSSLFTSSMGVLFWTNLVFVIASYNKINN